MYGSGLVGSGFDVFKNAADQRLAKRIHFYVNRGEGIHPEAGVGGQLHRVSLTNLYDADVDSLGLRGAGPMSLEAQTKILDAGFDGFMVRGHNRSGLAVLLGDRSVPVEPLGRQAGAFNAGIVVPRFNGPIWRSSRDFVDINDIDSFVDDGGLDDQIPVGETEELTADEKDKIRAEFEEAQKPTGPASSAAFDAIPEGRAKTMPYTLPPRASLKAAGMFAERAFPELEYRIDDHGIAVAHTKAGGRERTFRLSPLGAGEFRAGSGNMTDLGDGAAFGIKGSFELAKSWNQRIAASEVLLETGFDLASTVTPAALARVVSAWDAIGKAAGAQEFGDSTAVDAFTDENLLKVADSMLDGTRYMADVAAAGHGTIFLEITDTTTNVSGTAGIELTGSRGDRRLVMHTQDLEQGSGIGKPFYQVAFAFGHELGIKTNADPGGLMGVNNWRRTEQMMSAAVRAGEAGSVNPGIGQRIYGWNPAAKTKAEKARNMGRIALAAARNAVEADARVADLAYDLSAGAFSWANGKAGAEAFVKRLIDSSDAKAVSLSRSTLARAAVTLEALRGDVAVPAKVARPILYSSRGSMLDEYADIDSDGTGGSNGASVGPEQGNYTALEGKTIERTYTLLDGREAVLRMDAAAALADIDERTRVAEELRKCLQRPA